MSKAAGREKSALNVLTSPSLKESPCPNHSSYVSQCTSNLDEIPEDQHYKYIDDLTILEIINLISVGICEYNFRNHVASDIGVNQLFVPTKNLQSQTTMHKIQDWTNTNKMKLNKEKMSERQTKAGNLEVF